MLRSNLLFVTCLVLIAIPQEGIESPTFTPTQQVQESSQSQGPNSGEESRVKAEVAEIMAIREQIGGGVAETLGDLSLEMPGSSRQTSVMEPPAKPLDPKESFAQQIAKQSRNHVPQPKTAAAWTFEEAGPKLLNGPIPEHRAAIRTAARMLEQAAALLEEAQQYDQADGVRKNASQLWRSAR